MCGRGAPTLGETREHGGAGGQKSGGTVGVAAVVLLLEVVPPSPSPGSAFTQASKATVQNNVR
jgi:hypothetical protein